MVVKTIDVKALEWWDKVNGNSYFAGSITINYRLPDEATIYMPFQYGYGDQYRWEATKVLVEAGYLPEEANKYGAERYCRENGQRIYRGQKIDKCLKRELTYYTKLHEQQSKNK